MYIKQLKINSFGCISDKEFNLDKGLNIIYGKNGSGKSTLLAFIVFMFYGVKIKKEAGKLSFKEKFLPWDGKAMQGTLIFEHKKSTYSLSRIISQAENTVSLFCVNTGAQIKERSILNSVGEYFFGVNAQVFYNTVFINETRNNYSSDEIADKLTACNEKSQYEVSYNNLMDIIDSEISILSSSRRKSAAIPKLAEEIRMKRRSLSSFENFNSDNIPGEIDVLQRKISDNEKQISLLKAEAPAIGATTETKSSVLRLIILICIAALSVLFCVTSFYQRINLINQLLVLVCCIPVIIFSVIGVKKILKRERDTKLFTLKQKNDKIITLTEEIADMRLEIERKSQLLNKNVQLTEDAERIYEEIEELEREHEALQKQLQAYELARLAVSNAYSEIQSLYAPELSENATAIFSKLTGRKYNELLIDEKLNVSIEGAYGYKSSDSYSLGFSAMADFAKRFAISDIIFSSENVPVFLDDVFSSLDDEHFAEAFDFITKLANNTQVFYVTCHQNDITNIKSNKTNVLFL